MKKKKTCRNLTVYKSSQPKYPNAADANYITQKLLDIATAIASGVGLVTAMVFLVTLT